MANMTKQEFEQQYADNGGTTIDVLHRLGLYVIPCDCGEDDCLGWRMQSRSERLTEERKENNADLFEGE